MVIEMMSRASVVALHGTLGAEGEDDGRRVIEAERAIEAACIVFGCGECAVTTNYVCERTGE